MIRVFTTQPHGYTAVPQKAADEEEATVLLVHAAPVRTHRDRFSRGVKLLLAISLIAFIFSSLRWHGHREHRHHDHDGTPSDSGHGSIHNSFENIKGIVSGNSNVAAPFAETLATCKTDVVEVPIQHPRIPVVNVPGLTVNISGSAIGSLVVQHTDDKSIKDAVLVTKIHATSSALFDRIGVAFEVSDSRLVVNITTPRFEKLTKECIIVESTLFVPSDKLAEVEVGFFAERLAVDISDANFRDLVAVSISGRVFVSNVHAVDGAIRIASVSGGAITENTESLAHTVVSASGSASVKEAKVVEAIEVVSVSGGVDLSSSTGRNATVISASGHSSANDVSVTEAIFVVSVSGSVDVENVSGQSLGVSTASGRVRVTEAHVSDDFNVGTVSGSTDVVSSSCKNASISSRSGSHKIHSFTIQTDIEIASTSGSVEVTGLVLPAGDADNLVHVSTLSGSAKLEINGLIGTYDLQTWSGRVQVDGTELHDEVVKRNMRKGHRGETAEGKDELRVSSTSGSISASLY